MTAHALLGASAAHRWMACPPSAKLEQEFPDSTSSFAAEGTLAHSVCELKLRSYLEVMTKRTFNTRYNKLKKDELWQDEMDGFTDQYFEYIKSILLGYESAPYVVVEKTVHFEKYVPAGFGTADCLIFAGDDLHVCDFKYGKGVEVSADENPQMMLYALGAIEGYRMLYSFKTVYMHIIQPRLNNFSEFVMSTADLVDWGTHVVKPLAELAIEGKGNFVAGDHCRFCRAKARCKARCEYYASVQNFQKQHTDPRLITMDDLGRYLSIAKQLEHWAKDLQEFGLSSCLEGKEVPGWKAVEGRKSRDYTDQDMAFQALNKAGFSDDVLYDRIPLTVAKAEKLIGKKDFTTLMKDFIVTNPGKPTLAPSGDKRPAITNLVSAADVFNSLI